MCLTVARLEPEDVSGHCLAGDLASQLGRDTLAESSFRKTIAIAPNKSMGYRELARLFIKTHRYAEATSLAKQATERENLGANHFVLALACERSGDLAYALSAVKRAIQLNPDNLNFRRYHEYLQTKQGK